MAKEAVAIVVIKDQHVYWGRRLKLTDNYGKIEFPGGKRDAEDATPEESARRELREEMGLENASLLPLGKQSLESKDFGRYETHGFLAILPPDVEPVNAEPQKKQGWFRAPMVNFLRVPDTKLLPGTREFLMQAMTSFAS